MSASAPAEVPSLRILGTRGIPASHGGFETFAERLALYLVASGWKVAVYCQQEGRGPITVDSWSGVQRIHIPVAGTSARSTMRFDWEAIRHAAHHRDLCLTLGYNTALFCAWLRLQGVPNVINMDGIEWKRAKWGRLARCWFWLNERAGGLLGDHLVADHPAIADHLARHVDRSRITTIPYGADGIEAAPFEPLHTLGLAPRRYLSLIARPEPENSVLEAVRAFSRQPRGVALLVLGHYRPDHAYHAAVRAAASGEVIFAGAIYDAARLQALRFHSLAYVHGHRVGGTNPSLIEALAAGNPVLAHDNGFNRWVAGDAADYFASEDEFEARLVQLLGDGPKLAAMACAARTRATDAFNWPDVLGAYEALLRSKQPKPA